MTTDISNQGRGFDMRFKTRKRIICAIQCSATSQ